MHDSVIITNIYNKLSLVRDATTLLPNECMQHLGFARVEGVKAMKYHLVLLLI